MRRGGAAIALAAVVAALAGCGGGGDEQTTSTTESEQNRAVAAALAALVKAQAAKQDLGSGPCIAEQLPGLPDWVVDIAHDPRQPVDDQPANQCRRFASGEAHHFVELTPQGDVIRAQ